MLTRRGRLPAVLVMAAMLATAPAWANDTDVESPATGNAPGSIAGHNPPVPPVNAPLSPQNTPQSTSSRYRTAKPEDSAAANRHAVKRRFRQHHRQASTAQ